MNSKSELLKEFSYMGNYIFERLEAISEQNLDNFNRHNTILIIVDMNNGFAKHGNLYSERIEKLINPIVKLANKIHENNIPIICFSDSHSQNSIEFLNYPKHCLTDTNENQIIDEIRKIKDIKIIPKNSTNGFFAKEFKPIFNKDNFIIVGNCTDICVYQFAITLKSYFTEFNKNKNIIVPMNFVDTFELKTHKANFMNYVFLNSMIDNGIEVIKLKLD